MLAAKLFMKNQAIAKHGWKEGRFVLPTATDHSRRLVNVALWALKKFIDLALIMRKQELCWE